MGKGTLISADPYKIVPNGPKGMSVSIGRLSMLKVGDRVYQKKLDDGSILLIPEKIYQEED